MKEILNKLTKIFEVRSRFAPKIMTEILKFKDHSYYLRENNCIELWEILPENTKRAESL